MWARGVDVAVRFDALVRIVSVVFALRLGQCACVGGAFGGRGVGGTVGSVWLGCAVAGVWLGSGVLSLH